MLINTHREEM